MSTARPLSDKEVASLPMNYSDDQLLTTPDHLLNRRELIRKAQLMFS